VLATLLRDRDVRRVFVGGLATDYCVHDTVLDALSQGFNVAVLGDAIRGVNLQPGDETRAIREMIERGASLLERPDVPG
jgi:nicotinamidase/pyrazinamidase